MVCPGTALPSLSGSANESVLVAVMEGMRGAASAAPGAALSRAADSDGLSRPAPAAAWAGRGGRMGRRISAAESSEESVTENRGFLKGMLVLNVLPRIEFNSL